MKKLMQQFRRVSRSAQALILILAAAALALVLEIGVFHISFFTQDQETVPPDGDRPVLHGRLERGGSAPASGKPYRFL